MNDSAVRTPISAPKGLKLSENDQFQTNIAVLQCMRSTALPPSVAIWHQIGLVASKLAARPCNLDHFRVIAPES